MITLRYSGRCVACRKGMLPDTRARWDGVAKTATCVPCMDAEASAPISASDGTGRCDVFQVMPIPAPASEAAVSPAPSGPAGGSAQREHDRRHTARQTSIRDRHPRLGGLILALTDDPTSTKVWAKGAEGERRVARRLDGLDGEGVVGLHDRRIPRSKANIDHIVVGKNGVYVIDTKRYDGRVELRSTGSVFRRGQNKLFVNGRDKTTLIEGMSKQILAVDGAAADLMVDPPVLICPVLCFVDGEWGAFAKPFTINGVRILWPKALSSLVRSPGPLTNEQVTAISDRLAERLPPA